MVLEINGVDYSDFVQQKTDIVETPRYIDGVNAGTSINGTAIRDRVATKYDISIKIKPLDQSRMKALLQAIETSPVAVIYTSVMSDTTRSIDAQATISSLTFITTDNGGNRVYGEATIAFEEN